MSELDSIKDLLDYDPETGVFTWKKRASGRVKAGQEAGCLAPTGYVVIRVRGKLYPAHRLAWLMYHGEPPSDDIDHIDGWKTNNAIGNLRMAPQVLNQQNRKRAAKHSETRILGVCFDKVNKKWRAEIQTMKKRTFLGRFNTAEEAKAAYLEAKRKQHAYGTI